MNDTQCDKCKKDFKFANIQLFCQHWLCDQCLRGAHVQTQIQNQNSLGSEKNKNNQLNCPQCNALTFLNDQEYQYIQSILLHEITVQDEQNIFQESFNFNQAPKFVENQINNEDEFEKEEVRQQNLKQKEEIQAQIEKLNEQISQKQKKLEILRVESKRKQDSQLQTQIIVLKQSTKIKQFLEAQQLNIPIDQGISQLQKLNEDLKQKKEQNQQQLTNLISKIISFNYGHFENIKKQYQFVIVFKNQIEEKRKKNQEEIDLIMDKKRNILTLNEEINQLKQINQQKEEIISIKNQKISQEKIQKLDKSLKLPQLIVDNKKEILPFQNLMIQQQQIISQENIQKSQDNLICKQCNLTFGFKDNIPISLDCKHTVCDQCCLKQIKANKTVKCPFDSEVFQLKKTKLRKKINYGIIQILQKEQDLLMKQVQENIQIYLKNEDQIQQTQILISETQNLIIQKYEQFRQTYEEASVQFQKIFSELKKQYYQQIEQNLKLQIHSLSLSIEDINKFKKVGNGSQEDLYQLKTHEIIRMNQSLNKVLELNKPSIQEENERLRNYNFVSYFFEDQLFQNLTFTSRKENPQGISLQEADQQKI